MDENYAPTRWLDNLFIERSETGVYAFIHRIKMWISEYTNFHEQLVGITAEFMHIEMGFIHMVVHTKFGYFLF
ncbi:hypothetical protein GCM10023187_36380 [Nibrella viscosa]|uniref:Transposase n=1 Tax=Nibrella viscosa TaxID=1084524 RepID=A0ABP8KMM9_9BACT